MKFFLPQTEGTTKWKERTIQKTKFRTCKNHQTDVGILRILEHQRQAGETDNYEIERRNECAEN